MKEVLFSILDENGYPFVSDAACVEHLPGQVCFLGAELAEDADEPEGFGDYISECDDAFFHRIWRRVMKFEKPSFGPAPKTVLIHQGLRFILILDDIRTYR